MKLQASRIFQMGNSSRLNRSYHGDINNISYTIPNNEDIKLDMDNNKFNKPTLIVEELEKDPFHNIFKCGANS
jgi:hypothetical protein